MTNAHSELSDYFLAKAGGLFHGSMGRAVANDFATELIALGYVKHGESDPGIVSEVVDSCISSNEMGDGYVNFRLDNDEDPFSLVADRYDDETNPQVVTSTHRITVFATKL